MMVNLDTLLFFCSQTAFIAQLRSARSSDKTASVLVPRLQSFEVCTTLWWVALLLGLAVQGLPSYKPTGLTGNSMRRKSYEVVLSCV